MATQIIDGALHVAAFPATYTGPGNLIGNCVQSLGKDIYGYFTSANNPVQINCGFSPLQVDITDTAGVLTWTWTLGLPATNTIKTATAAMTIDTTSAIVVTTDLAGNGYVTLSAALVGNAKLINFHIQG